MKYRYRVVTVDDKGEVHLNGFHNCIDAFNFSFANAKRFVSYRDFEQCILIQHIDALTAYYENMMI